MRVIKSTNKSKLEAINLKINNYMKANIPNYNATQWGEIIKHKTSNEYILTITDDNRNPMNTLSASEKNEVIDEKYEDWVPSNVGS